MVDGVSDVVLTVAALNKYLFDSQRRPVGSSVGIYAKATIVGDIDDRYWYILNQLGCVVSHAIVLINPIPAERPGSQMHRKWIKRDFLAV